VERLVGRERTNAALCRLDLDLLLYGRRVEAERRLPRPGILTEPFVLAPLAELGPTVAHPLSGETLAAAWCAMPAGEVSRVVRLGRLVSL
jgi:7,8-dihydro-6-hydroxymethylpterin-pyrophosphokinase